MSDAAMVAMQEARNVLLSEKQKGLATREGAIALTQLETAILWREHDLVTQNSPNADIAIKSQSLAARAEFEGDVGTDSSKKKPTKKSG